MNCAICPDLTGAARSYLTCPHNLRLIHYIKEEIECKVGQDALVRLAEHGEIHHQRIAAATLVSIPS